MTVLPDFNLHCVGTGSALVGRHAVGAAFRDKVNRRGRAGPSVFRVWCLLKLTALQKDEPFVKDATGKGGFILELSEASTVAHEHRVHTLQPFWVFAVAAVWSKVLIGCSCLQEMWWKKSSLESIGGSSHKETRVSFDARRDFLFHPVRLKKKIVWVQTFWNSVLMKLWNVQLWLLSLDSRRFISR